MLNLVRTLIDKAEQAMMVISMALVTIVITTQVVLRYFFNDSITWAEELTRFTIIWMSFIAASMGVRYGNHISVDLITATAPARVGHALKIVSATLGILFGLALFLFGGELFLHAMQRHQVSSAMQVPMYQVYVIFPLSGVLVIFRYADFLFNTIAGREPVIERGDGELGG